MGKIIILLPFSCLTGLKNGVESCLFYVSLDASSIG